MKIAIGSDHGGLELKDKVTRFLTNKGIEVLDKGTSSSESVDYPDYAALVARSILTGEADLGILVCGTGIGISIAANRFKGIRAGLVYSRETARLSREHNNANILVAGGRTMDHEQVLEWVDIWLNSEFEGGRHLRRIEKIDKLV